MTMEERAVVVMPILMIMTWRTTDSHDSQLMRYKILPSTVLVSTLCLFCIFHWHSHL
jgi:hypothetical protein